MTRQIVITEKGSQAKDVRAAVGSRYGTVFAAEGHLLDLCEPEDVNPTWKRWSTALLKPDGLYGTKPATGGNRAAKLNAIRAALKTADRVWLATDCDREGQLIGQEVLEHCRYRGEVMRVMFTAQDAETIRAAFRCARPNVEHGRCGTDEHAFADAASDSLRKQGDGVQHGRPIRAGWLVRAARRESRRIPRAGVAIDPAMACTGNWSDNCVGSGTEAERNGLKMHWRTPGAAGRIGHRRAVAEEG